MLKRAFPFVNRDKIRHIPTEYAFFHAKKPAIMARTNKRGRDDVVVYLEYALLENFILDAILLSLALRASGATARKINVVFAAALGSVQAVLIPIVPLPRWVVLLVKLCGGAIVCMIAICRGKNIAYLKTTLLFYLFTALAGGILTFFSGVFGGIPLWFEGAFFAGFYLFGKVAVNIFRRARKTYLNTAQCTLSHAGRTVRWKGLVDSGNMLYFRGNPVCVLSSVGVFALFGAHPVSEGRMTVQTVNGERESPVFRCERLSVGKKEWQNVYLTVGELKGECQIIIHTALTEGEHVNGNQRIIKKDDGRRGRRSLFVRK